MVVAPELKSTSLFDLLDLDPYTEGDKKRLDGNAIIKEVEQNPNSVEVRYKFTYAQKKCLPVHQAIKLGASINVIDALLSHGVLTAEQGGRENDLELALLHKAPIEVVSLILEKRPKSILEKNKFGYTALRSACLYESPLEVVDLLVNTCPDAVRELDMSGYTPLHAACRFGAPLSVVSLILNSWPHALRVKDLSNYTPLHVACQYNAPLDVKALLLHTCPDASREKTTGGYTPLHLVCRYRAPPKVIKMLLDVYPEATLEKNNFGMTPLDLGKEYGASEDIQKLISNVPILLDYKKNLPSPMELMSCFIENQWQNGVLMVLDRNPEISKSIALHTTVMADFLLAVGRFCDLTTMWEVLRNEQDLLAGV
mmetsp:Transcript_29653/g.43161  ORF Transcript_29653/g.43161 Transcript_29653/m.43161 type:complete len:369 (-) Transcript_29653:56-1162(-)